MKNLRDKWFYFPTISLAAILIYELIKLSTIITDYPLHNLVDTSSYISRLYFFKELGYTAIVSNWYGGFPLLKFYSPLWLFLNYPFTLIFENLYLVIYLTTILILAGLALVFLQIGKSINISRIKSVFFYLLFVLFSSSYYSLFVIGRFPTFLAYIFFFVCLIYLINYEHERINISFLWMSIPYALILLSHQQEFLLFSILLSGIFITREVKEKVIIILTGMISLILSSFWLIPFLDNAGYVISNRILLSTGGKLPLFDNFISTGNIIVAVLFFSFYLYYAFEPSSKKLIMYLPLNLLALLYLTRIYTWIPILQNLCPLTMNSFLFFFAGYFLFRTNLDTRGLKKIFKLGLQVTPMIIIAYTLLHPAMYTYSTEDHDLIKQLNSVDNNYLILFDYEMHSTEEITTLTPLASSNLPNEGNAISYLTLKNLTTPDGGFPEAAKINNYLALMKNKKKLLESQNCLDLKDTLAQMQVYDVITNKKLCETYNKCEFKRKDIGAHMCVFHRD